MDQPNGVTACSTALVLPLRTVSAANAREHWTRKAARNRKERTAVAVMWQQVPTWRFGSGPLVVTLTRYGKRDLDDDNLAGSFKAIRDEVAKQLGRDDGPKSGIRWQYEQARGDYAVRIQIEQETK